MKKKNKLYGVGFPKGSFERMIKVNQSTNKYIDGLYKRRNRLRRIKNKKQFRKLFLQDENFYELGVSNSCFLTEEIIKDRPLRELKRIYNWLLDVILDNVTKEIQRRKIK